MFQQCSEAIKGINIQAEALLDKQKHLTVRIEKKDLTDKGAMGTRTTLTFSLFSSTKMYFSKNHTIKHLLMTQRRIILMLL